MASMTLAEFRRLGPQDFEDAAVFEGIAQALQERDAAVAHLREVLVAHDGGMGWGRLASVAHVRDFLADIDER